MTSAKNFSSSQTDKLVSLLRSWTNNEEEFAEKLKWWKQHDEEIQDFVDSSNDEKTIEYVFARCHSDALIALHEENKSLLSDILRSKDTELSSERSKKSLIARAFVEEDRKKSEALAKGRDIGVKARKEKAKKNRTDLENAVVGLFDKPDKPGWGWTNSEIVKFLAPRFAGIYTSSTIAQTVKRIAVEHRKARKLRQAKQFLNR
jgi:hypothetical protein